MDMFSDYRVVLMFVIEISLTAYFTYLYIKYSNHGRWRKPEFSDFNPVEIVFSFLIFSSVLTGLWYWGRDIRIKSYNEQIGGYINAMWTVDGSHQESEEKCTGDGDGRTCYTEYYTVYHREYFVTNTTGDWWSGSKWYQRVNKSCNTCEPYSVPAYYLNSYVGKPVSLNHSYPNYLSAMNEKLYGITYDGLVSYLPDICPVSPDSRINEHSVVKAMTLGFPTGHPVSQEVYGWNFYSVSPEFKMNSYDPNNIEYENVPLYMDTMFGYLGSEVQGDTHIYLVNSTSVEYAQMCMAKWKNGAKNAIYVFVFGSVDGDKFNATSVYVGVGVDGSEKNTGITSDNEANNEHMKYDISKELMEYFNNGGEINRSSILSIVFENVRDSFVRQEMKNFEPLKHFVYPSSGWMTFVFVVMVVLSAFIHTWFANNNE